MRFYVPLVLFVLLVLYWVAFEYSAFLPLDGMTAMPF